MRYYYRVQDRAHRLGSTANALQWVRQHDEAERGCWVDKIRNSDETLGEIVHAVFMTREAMWEIPLSAGHQQRTTDTKGLGKGTGIGSGTKAHDKVKDKGKDGAGTDWAKGAGTLKDGTELCRLYNAGKCKSTNCSRAHKCNVVKPSGR
eukprot:1466225-Heterocapsa_arctica.AAC.1